MSEYQGFATGWFAVGFSGELAPGEVKPLHYFDRQLVMFRGEDGRVRVMDAFCPHLGAHLGHGGKVEGCTIRCPFHAWRFGEDGTCVEIPYAQKIPPRAKVEPWRVQEVNDVIFVYHDALGRPPEYEMPVFPEYGTADWLPWTWNLFRMKTQPREIVENLADRAHFPFVHQTEIDEFDFEVDGHTASQITRGRAIFGEKQEKFALKATYHGPGELVTRMGGVLKSLQLVLVTPIDQNHLDLRYAVTLKRIGTDEQMMNYMQAYLNNLRDGFIQDQVIWEHKVYRERPVLCDGDGPIGKLRSWYKRFYQGGTV